jgi:DNA-binding transcriptional LysR family regulator
MDWSRVPVFLEVVEQGSFTLAAKRLGAPKSTVSRSVSALERELGAQLLQRTTRALELTEAGRGFYERAKAARAALDEAQAEAVQASDEATGLVRLSVPHDAWPMAELLARFSVLHPQVSIELLVTNRHVNLVEESVDLALRAGRLEDSSLVSRTVGPSDLALFAAPEYLGKHPAPRTVDQLHEHEFVLFRGRQGKQRLRLKGPRGSEKEVTVRGRFNVDDLAFVRALVLEGHGIGALPLFLSGCVHETPLQPVLPGWSLGGGGVHIVMPAAKYVPARVRLLADFLFEHFKVRCTKHGTGSRR